MQRVTGQQRYAAEISRRLLSSSRYREIAPSRSLSRSTLRVWAWLQFVLPFINRSSLLLSMTSRAPLLRGRQVIVIHDLFVLTNPEWFSRKYYLTHAPILRIQLGIAAGIVAVSAPVAEQLGPLFRGPVVVAPNAPSLVFAERPTDRGDTTHDDALDALGLERGSYLLAVGSLDPRKNLYALAQAYGRLSAAERTVMPLVIVGGGSAVFKNQDIRWPVGTVDAGFVSDEELRGLYGGSRAVVFVSLAEGFGLPLVEAAAAGATALIISDIPVFHWICGDSATYVNPASIDSIANALAAAITTSPENRPPMFDPSRFNWDDSAAIVAQFCESPEVNP